MSEQHLIVEGPDGRLYEVPWNALEPYAVPGARVPELRNRLAAKAGPPSGHYAPGEVPSHELARASASPAPHATAMPQTLAIQAPPGAQVTLHFHFSPPQAQAAASVQGYHMAQDEFGIPSQHTEMLWGDYIDKQGNPAVGFHSHDPVTGNAQ